MFFSFWFSLLTNTRRSRTLVKIRNCDISFDMHNSIYWFSVTVFTTTHLFIVFVSILLFATFICIAIFACCICRGSSEMNQIGSSLSGEWYSGVRDGSDRSQRGTMGYCGPTSVEDQYSSACQIRFHRHANINWEHEVAL